jgi:hypothetical protein
MFHAPIVVAAAAKSGRHVVSTIGKHSKTACVGKKRSFDEREFASRFGAMKFERIENPPVDVDFAEHERTYAFFLRMIAICALHVLSCLLAVAIGGLFGDWRVALFLFLAATMAAGLGLTVGNLGWKPGAAMLALSFAAFALTA